VTSTKFGGHRIGGKRLRSATDRAAIPMRIQVLPVLGWKESTLI